MEDTKALGGWNEPGSFRNCYDRTPPVEAYLGAASFIASRRDAYFVSRSALGASSLSLDSHSLTQLQSLLKSCLHKYSLGSKPRKKHFVSA